MIEKEIKCRKGVLFAIRFDDLTNTSQTPRNNFEDLSEPHAELL